MNNADKIREMSEEKLANFIAEYMDCDVCPASYGPSCKDAKSCRQLLLCWLNENAGEGEDLKQSESTTERPTEDDAVNHPSHYTAGKVECIDALEAATTGLDGFEGYCTGNIIKYLWRWKHKNGLQDLEKAKCYLERLIKLESEKKWTEKNT